MADVTAKQAHAQGKCDYYSGNKVTQEPEDYTTHQKDLWANGWEEAEAEDHEIPFGTG